MGMEHHMFTSCRIPFCNCFIYGSLHHWKVTLLNSTGEIPQTYDEPVFPLLHHFYCMCDSNIFLSIYMITGIRNNFQWVENALLRKKKQNLSCAESLMVSQIMPEIMTELVAFHSEDICHLSENCQVCHEREFIVLLSTALWLIQACQLVSKCFFILA